MAVHGETRLSDESYLTHIQIDSTRFADVLQRASPQARVPTCPEWSAEDLCFHLVEVQHFWARVLSDGVSTVAEAQALPQPRRRRDHVDLIAATRTATAELVAALRATTSSAPAWSWSTEQTAGFTFRRQAHEACMHRVDAELVVAPDGSARSPIDSMLADDGVDEALRIVHAARPEWASFTPGEGRMLRLVATDTGTTWLVTMGRLTGIDPDDGSSVDEPHIDVAQDDPADGTVHPRAILTGAAEDLYCRLWHRPTIGDLHRNGDLVLVAEFEAFLASGDL